MSYLVMIVPRVVKVYRSGDAGPGELEINLEMAGRRYGVLKKSMRSGESHHFEIEPYDAAFFAPVGNGPQVRIGLYVFEKDGGLFDPSDRARYHIDVDLARAPALSTWWIRADQSGIDLRIDFDLIVCPPNGRPGRARAFEHHGCQGRELYLDEPGFHRGTTAHHHIYRMDYGDMIGRVGNDTVSSVFLPSGSGHYVHLYEHSQFRGNSTRLTGRRFLPTTFALGADWNDRVSSIEFGKWRHADAAEPRSNPV